MLYKIGLYKTSETVVEGRYLSDVIVDKSLLNAVEIITAQKINVIDFDNFNEINNEQIQKDIKRYGFSLYVKKQCLIKENKVTKEDVSYYMDEFEDSLFLLNFHKMLQIEENEKLIKKIARRKKWKNM